MSRYMDVDFKRPENLGRYLMMIDRGIYKTDKQHIQSAIKKWAKMWFYILLKDSLAIIKNTAD